MAASLARIVRKDHPQHLEKQHMDTNTPALTYEELADEIMEVIDKHEPDIREALEALLIVRSCFEEQLLDCYEKYNPAPVPCNDCGVNTIPATNERGGTPKGCCEYYMVHDELWAKAGMKNGFLCVGCLEQRLGRELIAGDFVNNFIQNDPDFSLHTPRLRSRLTSGGKSAVNPGAVDAYLNGGDSIKTVLSRSR
jgi:hypothetical protein